MLLKTKEAARYLGLSMSFLEKDRVTRGRIRFVKMGRSVRYRIEDLDAFVSNHQYQSTSQYEENIHA